MKNVEINRISMFVILGIHIIYMILGLFFRDK